MKTKPWENMQNVKEGDNYPATFVSWEDAVKYCRKLSASEGKQYRLPTEAEWEYACRGGQSTAYSFGNRPSLLGNYGWFSENAYDIGEKYAHEVGTKNPNPFGLHDMHGNLWEWCSDWYETGYYGSSPGSDPQGPSRGSLRVVRGGSWRNEAAFCRSAARVRVGSVAPQRQRGLSPGPEFPVCPVAGGGQVSGASRRRHGGSKGGATTGGAVA